MTYITSYFRNIIIFLIFMNFIEIIMPSKKYKKYIDFVLGLILISFIVSPIVNIINKKPSFTFQNSTESFTQNVYNDTNDYTKILYENQLSSQFSKYLENQNIYSANTKVLVDENYNIIEIYCLLSNSTTFNNVENLDIKSIKNKISNEYNLSIDNIHINIDN